jgi:hypothetical protein
MMEGFMKHAVEMGSTAIIFRTILIKFCSALQKLMGGYIDTDRMVIA